MTEWKKIPSFPDYEINDRGVIRKDGEPIKLGRTYDGYIRCTLKKDGRTYYRTAHPLVLEAFVGPRPLNYDACHNDGSKDNNHINNLRWDTRRNNILDRDKHGTSNHGERNGRAVVDAKTVAEIRAKYASGISGYKLLKEYKISNSQMYRILNKEHWGSSSREGSAT